MATKTCLAWIGSAPGARVEQGEIELPPLRATDVEVEIKACGICSSDIDILRAPMAIPPYQFPLVAGHEGVGVVSAVGELVSHVKVGDVVGCGVYRNSCNTCEACASGKDNTCPQRHLMFAKGSSGCFAQFVRLDGRYAIPIPHGLDMKYAGPLMCAGLTTFAPFRNHNVKPGDRVGVVGIGGLGHLSIQFAKAFGCEVYAFSSSADKEHECRKLGAHHYVNLADEGALASVALKLDFLMVTAAGGNVNWKALMNTLGADGKMILMGISMQDIAVSPFALIGFQRSIVGSAAGSRAHAIDMLNFALLHNIRPLVEEFPASQVNEAMDKVKKNQVRYRAVITF
eukprot:Colp12_sorted_trinity150504_noHs@1218